MGTLNTRPFAVVTGGSSGIGFELARQFVINGHDVLIVGDTPKVHEAQHALETDGAVVYTREADLSTFDGNEQLVTAIGELGRPIDALALNAGVGVHGNFLETDLQEELAMIRLNIVSVVHLAKRLIPQMVARGRGRVLITSSVAGIIPATFMAVYGGTKAFDLQFAEAIREELKDSGVTVTALQPGATETLFFARADMTDTKVGADDKDSAALVARQAYEAMMAGKDKIYAGSLKTRLQGHLAEVMPEPMKAKQHRGLAEPGSANKKH